MGGMNITFDTHKFVKELREAGIPEPQAEVFIRAQQEILAQALDSTLATKGDVTTLKASISDLRTELRTEMAAVKGETALVKWMLGAVLALAIANFAKQFF